MDPFIAAATRIVGYLVPIVSEKAVELSKRLGETAVDKIAAWLERLRRNWADDAEASGALKKFEESPEAEQDNLRDILADRMQKEESLQKSAEQLAQDVGPLVVVTMKGGEVSVQNGPEFGNVLRGKVSVGMTLDKGRVQRGPKFGDIG